LATPARPGLERSGEVAACTHRRAIAREQINRANTMHRQSAAGILPAMVTVKLTADYYVYNLIDADGVVRYVGKGTGRRIYNHFRSYCKACCDL